MVLFSVKAMRLVDIDKFVFWYCRVKEGSGDVTLGRHPAKFNGEYHQRANGGPLYDGGVGVVEVKAFDLFVAADAEAGFKFLCTSVGVAFYFKCPG